MKKNQLTHHLCLKVYFTISRINKYVASWPNGDVATIAY